MFMNGRCCTLSKLGMQESLKCRRRVPEKCPADYFYGGEPLLEKVVVEPLQRKLGALLFLYISAQFHNLELTQGVIEIGCIGCPALGFNQAALVRLIPFCYKKVYRLVERHLAGMHLDPYNKTSIAQQRILQLPQANHLGIPGIACPRPRLAVTLVEHHLLAIMRPTFGIGIGSQKLAHGARCLWHPQELYVVSWISLG